MQENPLTHDRPGFWQEYLSNLAKSLDSIKCPKPEIEMKGSFSIRSEGSMEDIKTVRSRDGRVVGTRMCTTEGCRGTRYGVRWPDGKLTWVCGKGMSFSQDEGRII
jgi:hypothetical protein